MVASIQTLIESSQKGQPFTIQPESEEATADSGDSRVPKSGQTGPAMH